MKEFGLREKTLFHFHWIFKKKEVKSAKRTPHIYTYEPPFQKSWIRPWPGHDEQNRTYIPNPL